MRWWISLLCLSCAPTETGNPVTVALSAHTSDPSVAATTASGGIFVRSAWVGLADVRFVMAEDCDDTDSEVQLPGPLVVDLVSEPVLQAFETPPSDYCRVRLALEIVRTPEPARPELLDHSVVIEGETANGVPFLLASEVDAEFDVDSDTPFGLDAVVNELVLSFDLARWFAGINLDSGTPAADGTIRIDDENNDALLDAFEDNVEEALELYDDVDGNGRRDEEDRVLADSRP